MMNRWEHCVTHCDQEAMDFVEQYFADKTRRILLIGGAGFDPRSAVVSEALARVAKIQSAIFVREERSNPLQSLLDRANANVLRLEQAIPGCQVLPIEIFDAQDGAVVGAKRLIRLIAPLIEECAPTDILLDLSAFSIGISFPLVRFVFGKHGLKPGGPNVHLFVTEDPALDTAIIADHTDHAMYVPGFNGNAVLDAQSQTTRLWIPQLVEGRNDALRRIHQFVGAGETCPILPFPARNLRRGDELLDCFISEVSDAWEVDPRNYIYAAEREPVDLYRTLLRLDDARKRVYENHGGSMLVLSPIGSKVLALGALLAALERDFPVAYLESISYTPREDNCSPAPTSWPLVHLWLSGDAYDG
jgi:hypothetical protein